MGRAIDMEKDIVQLKIKIEQIENTLRGMVSKIDGIDEKSSKTKHIDLVEETKTGEGNAKKEKTNNETDDKSSVKPNKRTKARAKKSSKS